jgi:serine O-acetyltransferase
MTSSTPSFRRTLEDDLRAYSVPLRDRPLFLRTLKHTLSLLIFSPGFSTVFWYRVNRWMALRRVPGTRYLNARRYYWFANDISCYADIGPGLHIGHPSDIVIGAKSVIGKNAIILNGVTLGAKRPETAGIKPRIGDNAYLGTGAKILGGITIGDRVTIGALAFCDQDVPSDSVAYGIPLSIRQKHPPV